MVLMAFVLVLVKWNMREEVKMKEYFDDKGKSHTVYNWYDKFIYSLTPLWKRIAYIELHKKHGLYIEAM